MNDNKVSSKESENIKTTKNTKSVKKIEKENNKKTGEPNKSVKREGSIVNSITNNTNIGNTLINKFNTPDTVLPSSLKTKSIKKTETITNDNYNQYFDENGVLKPGTGDITLGSDLYNKNITITNYFYNPNNYTFYNSTVTLDAATINDNLNIVNTDERETVLVITEQGSTIEAGVYLSQKNKTSDCTLITKKGDQYIYMQNTAVINMESKKGTIFNNESDCIWINNCTLNMDCEEAMIANLTNVKSGISFSMSNITVKTKTATPLIIGNNSTVSLISSTVVVNEPSDEPIIYLENTILNDEAYNYPVLLHNYLETPFARGNETIKLIDCEGCPRWK